VVAPLLEALVYAVVFTQIITVRTEAGGGLGYTVFLTSGLFPFIAFAQMISRGSNSIKANAVYMRRSLVPSEIFVFKETMVSSFSLLVFLVILLVIALGAGLSLSWHVLLLPLFAGLLMLLGFGMSLPLANLRVLFPDLGEIIPVILQLWRWTLPIVFTDEKFPQFLRGLMSLNPPYYFIRAFRAALLEHQMPSLIAWLAMGFWIIFWILVSQWVAHQLRSEVKDLL
jgi:ABC-type polysaccharide/polyol phosphate export permease